MAPAKDAHGSKTVHMLSSITVAAINSLVFEGPGQAVMVNAISGGLGLRAAARKFAADASAEPAYFARVQLSSLIEAGIHRGAIKYTILPIVREICQERFPHSRVAQVTVPTAAVVLGEAAVIGPLTRGLICVTQKHASNLFSGMLLVARNEGIVGVYKGTEQIMARTVAFTLAQNLGMTLTDAAFDNVAPLRPGEKRPIEQQCVSAAVGAACGVTASMLNQIAFVEGHNQPGVSSFKIMMHTATTPSSWSRYTGAWAAKMAFKVPNIVVLMTLPSWLARRFG
jgi:hypothetical protein